MIARSYLASAKRLLLSPILFFARSIPAILSAAFSLLVPIVMTAFAIIISPARPFFLASGFWPGAGRVLLLWLACTFLWSIALIVFRALFAGASRFWSRFESLADEPEDSDPDPQPHPRSQP